VALGLLLELSLRCKQSAMDASLVDP